MAQKSKLKRFNSPQPTNVDNSGIVRNRDYNEIVQDVTELYSEVKAARPYKVYVALLTQTGTDAPVATVLENTLGFDIVWYYEAAGYYLMQNNTTGTLFDKNKTWINTPVDHYYNNNETPGQYWGQETPINNIGIIAPDGDGTLAQYPIEIRVYP